MFESSKLDLKPSFAALGSGLEYVENQLRSIENRKIDRALDVSLLSRGQSYVEDHYVCVVELCLSSELFDFSGSEKGRRVRLVALGRHDSDRLESVGRDEKAEFMSRVRLMESTQLH